MSEFDLIDLIRSRSAKNPHQDVELGIGDDAAVVQVSPGLRMVACADTLLEDKHFFAGTDPQYIGHKALAVNLSDLAAMGAKPRWALLCLSLPRADRVWLTSFIDGFFELADRYQVALIGGDTVQGPLSVTVQLLGEINSHHIMSRSAAQAGDDIWVSGSLGDAACAVERIKNGQPCPQALSVRLNQPQARVALGQSIATFANACIDLSDGLSSDLRHVLSASQCGANVHLDRLPLSDVLLSECDVNQARMFALTGGDDYELCFTSRPENREQIKTQAKSLGVAVRIIGEIVAQPGLSWYKDGQIDPSIISKGYQHFG